jgi:molybdenum cofactor guanylyltransferase
VDDHAGWIIDPDTLNPTLTDRGVVEATLSRASPADRLFLLALLGDLDQAITESAVLLDDPEVRQDPWRVLLLTADLYRRREDFEAAVRLQAGAWKYARSRSRQATTLQHIGKRYFQCGEDDRAAGCFQLALTMRRGFGDAELVTTSQRALDRVRQRLAYDAIVVAGGQGVRLGGRSGGAKASIPLAGWPLADHVLLAVSGASARVLVGPRRIALAEPVFCREQPAGAGPLAAIAEAAGRIRQPAVAVLAADLPFIGDALATLRARLADTSADAALLVDTSGRSNYLAAVWRTSALLKALDGVGDPANRPVRELYAGRGIVHVPDFDALGADVDTPADLRVAQERISRRSPGQLPAALLAWPRLELHAPS